MPSEDSNAVVVKRTIVSSPIIKKLVGFRAPNGTEYLVIVREQSLEVSSRIIPLPSRVRSVDVLQLPQEDLLCMILFSGYLLMVRILPDEGDALVLDSRQVFYGGGIYSDTIGHGLQCDPRGNVVCLSGLQNELKMISIQPPDDSMGLACSKFKDQFVIRLDGHTILDSCFLGPLQNGRADHVLFIVLYCTPEARIKVSLYEWWTDRPLSTFQLYGTLPLDMDIDQELPLFMVPVYCKGSGVVVVTPKRLILVTCHDILSGNVNLQSQMELGPMPLAFYREPSHREEGLMDVDSDLDSDYFYMTREGGALDLVKVSAEISIKSLLNVKLDLGCTFHLRPCDENGEVVDGSLSLANYALLTYGGDLAVGGSILLPLPTAESELEEDDDDNEPEEQEAPQLIEQFDNWAFVNDFEVIPSPSRSFSGKCLFAACGQGKTGAVCELTQGLRAKLFLDGGQLGQITRIFHIDDLPNDESLVILSYPWSTRVFSVTSDDGVYPELTDISEQCGLQVQDETLCAIYVQDYGLAQVTRGRVTLSNINSEALHKNSVPIPQGIYSSYGTLVAMVHSHDETPERALLSVYRIEARDDFLHKVGTTEVPGNDVSCVRLVEAHGVVYCFVGRHLPSLLIYKVSDNGITLEKEETELFSSEKEGNFPNDVILKEGIDESKALFYIGLREGSMISGTFDQAQNEIIPHSAQKLGDLPVNFVLSGNNMLINNGNLLICRADVVPTSPERVVFDYIGSSTVGATAFFTIGQHSKHHIYLATVLGGDLQIVKVELSPRVISRRIELGVTPRRLLYIEHLSALAVGVQASPRKRDRGPFQLLFVDPHRFSIITPPGQLCYGKRDMSGDGSKNDDATPVFSLDETVYSMAEWSITKNQKTYKYLLIGSGYDSNPSKGRVRILQSYRNKTTGMIEVVRQYSLTLTGGVYSICSLGQTAIVFSTYTVDDGASVHVQVLNRDSTNVFKMKPFVASGLPGPIVQLSCQWIDETSALIFASTSRNSIHALTFNGEKIEQVSSDGVLRATVNHVAIDGNKVLVSDKARQISCLSFEHGNHTMETVAKMELPTIISRIRQGDGPSALSPVRQEPRKGHLIATGIGGTIYDIEVMSLAEAGPLLQSSQRSQPDTLESTDRSLMHPKPEWSDKLVATDWVIDGDNASQCYS